MSVARNHLLVYRFRINWMIHKQKLKNTHHNYKKMFKESKNYLR